MLVKKHILYLVLICTYLCKCDPIWTSKNLNKTFHRTKFISQSCIHFIHNSSQGLPLNHVNALTNHWRHSWMILNLLLGSSLGQRGYWSPEWKLPVKIHSCLKTFTAIKYRQSVFIRTRVELRFFGQWRGKIWINL